MLQIGNLTTNVPGDRFREYNHLDMTNKGARLIFRHRQLIFKEEKLVGVVDMRIYEIPQRRAYEEGIKYSLTFARFNPNTENFEGDYLRYDNYKEHGHHKHMMVKRVPYEFESVEKLIENFYADLERILEEL